MKSPYVTFFNLFNFFRWRDTANQDLELMRSQIEDMPDTPVSNNSFTGYDKSISPLSFKMPDLSNQDDVALHMAKLLSENEELKRLQQKDNCIKRSHSLQSVNYDEVC